MEYHIEIVPLKMVLFSWLYLRYDAQSTHFLLRITPSLLPIGTIRMNKLSEGQYKLSRLVVLKEYRSFGFGRDLVQCANQWAIGHSDSQRIQISTHVQLYAKNFYAKSAHFQNLLYPDFGD